MPGTLSPAINTKVTITSKSINNDSVAMVFNKVTALNFDYFKGVVSLVDSEQGAFTFGLTLATVTTVTIVGTATTIVIS